MKINIVNADGTETTRTETRTEILARHSRMNQNHAEAMDFLESLHTGPHFEQIAREQAAHDWQVREQNRDLGLTTEINTSKELMPLDEVVERCSDILRRHQYGYKEAEAEEVEAAAAE